MAQHLVAFCRTLSHLDVVWMGLTLSQGKIPGRIVGKSLLHLGPVGNFPQLDEIDQLKGSLFASFEALENIFF